MPFPRFGRVTRAGEFERRRYQTDGRNPAAKHAILEMYQKHGVVFPDTPTMALHRGRIDLLAEHLRRDPKLLSRTFSHREIYPAEMGCRDPIDATVGTPLGGTTLLHMCVDYDEMDRDPADHQYPRWSPDSASLIYYSPAAESGSEGTLWEIAALGGVPRRLVSSVSGGDVSHDGKRIAYFRFSTGHVQLHVSSRESSGDQVIAQLPPDYKYLSPRWSPDDQQIGFQRGKIFEDEIFMVPSAGGEPRQMTQDGNQLSGFSWLPDGSGIVYTSARGSTVLYHPTFNIWVGRHNRASRQLTSPI